MISFVLFLVLFIRVASEFNYSFDSSLGKYYFDPYEKNPQLIFQNFNEDKTKDLLSISNSNSLMILKKPSYQLDTNEMSFSAEELLFDENTVKSYSSKAKKDSFIFTYYGFSIGSNDFKLIKVTYPQSNPNDRDFLIEIPDDNTKVRILPTSLENFFSIEQCKECSFKRKEKFYESYGFTLSYDERFDAEIEKVILIKKKDKKKSTTKAKFYANLFPSFKIHSTYKDNGRIYQRNSVYLDEIPFSFELDFVISIKKDELNEFTGRKINLLWKGRHYPNFRIESVNPNRNVFFFSLIIIFIIIELGILISVFRSFAC